MKLVEVVKATSAPGKNVYGTCTLDVELGKFDKLLIQHSTLKDRDGEWVKDNINNLTVGEIAGPCSARLTGEVRENDKGDVFLSVKHTRLDWESSVMLGHEGLAAIQAVERTAGPTFARRTPAPVGGSSEPDDDIPL